MGIRRGGPPVQRSQTTRPLQQRTPVRGDKVNLEALPLDKASGTEALGKVGKLDPADVDQFVRVRNAQLSMANGKQTNSGRIYGGPPVDRRGKVTTSEDAQQQLADTFASMANLFNKGLVTEADVSLLGAASAKLGDLLALKDDGDILQMLPPDLADRLQANLFQPLERLRAVTNGSASAIATAVARRDEDALIEKLSSIGDFRGADQFKTVDPAALGGKPATAVHRFAPGDLVAIGRTGNKTSMGVITGRDPDGFRVEVLSAGRDGVQRLGLKKLDFDEAGRRNPLKLGDHVQLPAGAPQQGELWVNQIAADGRAAGVLRQPDGKVMTLDADALAQVAQHLTEVSAATHVGDIGGVPRSSRESLERMLDDVWGNKTQLAGRGYKSIYRMYNAISEPNPRSIAPDVYLGGLAEAAAGRPKGAVSNTQSGHGDIQQAVATYEANTFDLGDMDKSALEQTFFRFQRAGWQPWAVAERLYINAEADHAPDVMNHIVKAILDQPEKFPGVEMAKVSGPAAVSERAENIVIYTTGPDATARLSAEMKRYQAAHPEHFKSTVPRMTEPVGVGMGMATGAEPMKYGGQKSFGSLRAEVISAALDKAVASDMDRQAFGELVDELLRQHDVDPAHPHKNLDTPPAGGDA